MTQETAQITPELIDKHGLTEEEYRTILKLLGREPSIPELGVFSVMYSEHCSYKNSRPILKLLPKEGKRVMIGAGEENAGVIDIGDGLCISFKIESHNHPSAVEPFQGAATGVGGILRDIFTMGARPILMMNSLRFGSLDSKRTRHLLKGVVGGIGFYGNCVGIPTVGGEVYFDSCYEGNPLVNAMCLGVAKKTDIARGKASGAGNPVYYLGASTGRDGMGGASFASREITEDSDSDRPAVQVGDPFMEKLLMEAVLELLQTDAVVGIQDMGAAGLTCSTCETAARGNSGIEIDTKFVPQRESHMTPYEILLSESQERMLVIIKKGKESIAEQIFKKWDLHAVKIGEVTNTGLMVVKHNDKEVCRIPAKAIADEAPVYTREEKKPEYLSDIKNISLSELAPYGDLNNVLIKLLGDPSIASKRWIYEQYDHMVRTNTLLVPGSDSAVVRLKGTKKKLSVTTDCNANYCYLDPYEGGKIAVAEAARNIVCSGALPLSITNCLNFGNPMKPEVFWQFRQCVQGMSDACKKFGTPVSGGNVSFYNESPDGAIDPTPVIGMVGLIEGRDPIPSAFQNENDYIVLIGENRDELGASQFVKVLSGKKQGIPPRLDLDEAARFNKFMLKLAEKEIIKSAHDISEGGLAVALAECCFSDPNKLHGAVVTLKENMSDEALLFGESQSRAIVTVSEDGLKGISIEAKKSKMPFQVIGRVCGGSLDINQLISSPVVLLRDIWESSIGRKLKGD